MTNHWYDISIPFAAPATDYVSMKLTSYDDPPLVTEMVNAACFGNVTYTRKLNDYIYNCRPNSVPIYMKDSKGQFIQNGMGGWQVEPPQQPLKSVLPSTEFLRWVELCKEHGLMPLSTTAESKDGGNYCTIHGKGASRHCVYAALCCYRFADSTPQIPWLIVKLLEKNPKIHFFQALHYVFSGYVRNSGHSFSILANYVYQTGDISNLKTNLMHSLGLCYFFKRYADGKSLADKLEEPKPSANYPGTAYAYGGYQYYGTTTTGEVGAFIKRSGFGIADLKSNPKLLHLNNLEDVLWPEWRPLYETDKMPEKNWLVDFFDSVMKEHK